MTEFDRTESKYIESIIQQAVQMPQIGEVTEVYEHTEPNDFSNFEANVILRDEIQERRHVPVATSGQGMLHVPSVGDMVIVHFLDESGHSEFPIVTQVLYNDVDRAPLGKEGLIRYKKGDMYFEMHPDGNWMRMAFKDGDEAEPNAAFQIEQDGKIKIGDGSGYGIVSDGNGNFTWYENNVNFVDTGATINW